MFLVGINLKKERTCEGEGVLGRLDPNILYTSMNFKYNNLKIIVYIFREPFSFF